MFIDQWKLFKPFCSIEDDQSKLVANFEQSNFFYDFQDKLFFNPENLALNEKTVYIFC